MPQLRDFYGIHHGEALVVCGLGNSVKSLRNPERFRTIGVNDIGRAFTPDYLFCMDRAGCFPPERLQYIRGSEAKFIFADHDLGIERDNVVRFPIRYSPTLRLDDPDALYMIGRPPTSPFAAALLAVHMGAKAIGLIGVDFTNGHFWASDGPHKLNKSLQGINDRFYWLGARLLDRGVKFFNLSAESRLTAHPHLTPDEFYDLQCSERPRSWTRPAQRILFQSNSPVNANTAAVARLINTHTPHSCRLVSPNSPDMKRGLSPEIERDLEEDATVRYRCNRTDFPVAFGSDDFLGAWENQLRPMLLGHSAPSLSMGRTRNLTLSVIVSQERATRDEAFETVRSLSVDLQSGDQVFVLGQQNGASRNGLVRFVETDPNESFIIARNRAAADANGDVLVFCDGNVQPPRQWTEPLLQAFANDRTAAAGLAVADMYDAEIKGFGMQLIDEELNTAWLPQRHNQPYAVPLLPGLFLAVRREVFEQLGGFDSGMRGAGADDLELCIRLWTSGYECLVAPALEVKWMNPFTAGALRQERYWPDLLHNLTRLAGVHFGEERFARFVEAVAHYAEFEQVYDSALGDDLEERRAFVKRERKFSDDWFFDKFAG